MSKDPFGFCQAAHQAKSEKTWLAMWKTYPMVIVACGCDPSEADEVHDPDMVTHEDFGCRLWTHHEERTAVRGPEPNHMRMLARMLWTEADAATVDGRKLRDAHDALKDAASEVQQLRARVASLEAIASAVDSAMAGYREET